MKPHLINKQAINRYRRKACKAYPLEYMEVLVGHIRPDSVLVMDILPVKHRGFKTYIEWTYEDFDVAREAATARGLLFLGSIHSHPNCLANPSEWDNYGSRDLKEHLMGIMEVSCRPNGKKYTKTEWWFPQLKIPTVQYVPLEKLTDD